MRTALLYSLQLASVLDCQLARLCFFFDHIDQPQVDSGGSCQGLLWNLLLTSQKVLDVDSRDAVVESDLSGSRLVGGKLGVAHVTAPEHFVDVRLVAVVHLR